MRPLVKVEHKSSSGILYSLQRRQGRYRKAGERGIAVVKARTDCCSHIKRFRDRFLGIGGIESRICNVQ